MDDLWLEFVALAFHYHSTLLEFDLKFLGYLAASRYYLIVVDTQSSLVNSLTIHMMTTSRRMCCISWIVMTFFNDL